MIEDTDETSTGIAFEWLRSYPFCVAQAPGHPLARRRSFTLAQVADEPLIALRRRDYAEYHRILGRLFEPLGARPRIAVECDGSTSMITEIETGRGLAIVNFLYRHIAGKRLIYRSLTDALETQNVSLARAKKGDVTPAGEKFCDIVRAIAATAKRSRV